MSEAKVTWLPFTSIYKIYVFIYLINIILPKHCEIFGKSLTKIKFNNWSNSIFNQYNSGNVGRMIYFRENSNIANLVYKGKTRMLCCFRENTVEWLSNAKLLATNGNITRGGSKMLHGCLIRLQVEIHFHSLSLTFISNGFLPLLVRNLMKPLFLLNLQKQGTWNL